jgi:hypothetical protein
MMGSPETAGTPCNKRNYSFDNKYTFSLEVFNFLFWGFIGVILNWNALMHKGPFLDTHDTHQTVEPSLLLSGIPPLHYTTLLTCLCHIPYFFSTGMYGNLSTLDKQMYTVAKANQNEALL